MCGWPQSPACQSESSWCTLNTRSKTRQSLCACNLIWVPKKNQILVNPLNLSHSHAPQNKENNFIRRRAAWKRRRPNCCPPVACGGRCYWLSVLELWYLKWHLEARSYYRIWLVDRRWMLDLRAITTTTFASRTDSANLSAPWPRGAPVYVPAQVLPAGSSPFLLW